MAPSSCRYAQHEVEKKPATPARKAATPCTKEPCVFKAKPASKTVRVLATKKLKEVVRSVTPSLRHGACDEIHEVRDEERCYREATVCWIPTERP